MNKTEKQEFLKNGGTLLRMKKTGKKATLQRKTIDKDWNDGVTNADEGIIHCTIDKLVANHPDKFQEDKTSKAKA
jgi:hypothetical protein